MVRPYNPLKMKGTDKLLHPLGVMLSGFKTWDKPVQKKLPVEVDLVELICNLGQLDSASVKDAVVGDWCLIAFYYLLRVGEYTEKNIREQTKQTVEFRMKDVTFFEKDQRGRIRQMPRNATEERILQAVGATLRLTNQKNGWKNVCVFHFTNEEEVLCPVRALGRRYVHIRGNAANDEEKLSAYWVNGVRFTLKDRQVSEALKLAGTTLDYPSRGIPIDLIDTHSLRAGGAMALHLNGYSDREIMKMGRWRGETFKEYIHECLSAFSKGMSKSMKKTFQFVNVRGGVDFDVTDVRGPLTDVTDVMINSPYDNTQ